MMIAPSAENGILIVEVAREGRTIRGLSILDAAVEASRLCFRPILITSFAFDFFATHSLRRTKATLIYRRTGNLRAVQLLLGHTKIESTVRYLGIEVDGALAIAERLRSELQGAKPKWLWPFFGFVLAHERTLPARNLG
jgi:integrase